MAAGYHQQGLQCRFRAGVCRPVVGTQLTGRTNGLMLQLMKNRVSSKRVMALVVTLLCRQAAPILLAQNLSPAPASAEAAARAPAPASESPAVALSSGVPDILMLARAHLSDEAIIAFILNSGRAYHLSASEILYLREQGVSNPVLTTMLNQRPNVEATAGQAVPQPAAQPAATQPPADWANSNPQPAPAATQYAPAYEAAAPVYAQPSTVYAYPAPSYGYYDSAPYYWGYPGLSFGIGFGGGYYGGYYGRGYYGGGYRGGGYYGWGGYHGGGGYQGGGGGHR